MKKHIDQNVHIKYGLNMAFCISGEDKDSLVNGLGTTSLQSKVGFLPFTIQQNKFQMGQNSKCKKLNPKSTRRKDNRLIFKPAWGRPFKILLKPQKP